MAAPDTTSAEWVAEAPSLCSGGGFCRTVTLSDFGKVRFTKASATSADGHTGSISDPAWAATSIQLVPETAGPGFGRYAGGYAGDPSATPTVLTARGSTFTVKWQGATETATAPSPAAPAPPGYYGTLSSMRSQ
jgi:hypothetical protein